MGERFAQVLNVQAPDYQPAWYVGPGFDGHRLGAFSSQLGSSLNGAIRVVHGAWFEFRRWRIVGWWRRWWRRRGLVARHRATGFRHTTAD